MNGMNFPCFRVCNFKVKFAGLWIELMHIFIKIKMHGCRKFKMSTFSADFATHFSARHQGDDIATVGFDSANRCFFTRFQNEISPCCWCFQIVEKLMELLFTQH